MKIKLSTTNRQPNFEFFDNLSTSGTLKLFDNQTLNFSTLIQVLLILGIRKCLSKIYNLKKVLELKERINK